MRLSSSSDSMAGGSSGRVAGGTVFVVQDVIHISSRRAVVRIISQGSQNHSSRALYRQSSPILTWKDVSVDLIKLGILPCSHIDRLAGRVLRI